MKRLALLGLGWLVWWLLPLRCRSRWPMGSHRCDLHRRHVGNHHAAPDPDTVLRWAHT